MLVSDPFDRGFRPLCLLKFGDGAKEYTDGVAATNGGLVSREVPRKFWVRRGRFPRVNGEDIHRLAVETSD